jgi:hypothetical protein
MGTWSIAPWYIRVEWHGNKWGFFTPYGEQMTIIPVSHSLLSTSKYVRMMIKYRRYMMLWINQPQISNKTSQSHSSTLVAYKEMHGRYGSISSLCKCHSCRHCPAPKRFPRAPKRYLICDMASKGVKGLGLGFPCYTSINGLVFTGKS